MIRKAIPGYEGLYEITEGGTVYALPKTLTFFDPRTGKMKAAHRIGKWRKPIKTRSGYMSTSLRKDGHAMMHRNHALVLKTFVGPRPPGFVARHLNGNKENNSLPNLAWGTVQDNEADKVRHGTVARGEQGGMAKLTTAQAMLIKKMCRPHDRSVNKAALARSLNVDECAIYDIVAGRTWKHLPQAYPSSNGNGT
jgi:hypothetical protein